MGNIFVSMWRRASETKETEEEEVIFPKAAEEATTKAVSINILSRSSKQGRDFIFVCSSSQYHHFPVHAIPEY